MARPRIRPNIFELPDSLLDKLLVHVDDESLVELGATCRKFNTKALTTFFDRHGILNPGRGMLLIYEKPPTSLKAVRRAMFVRDLEEIHYYFHPNVEKLFADVHDMTQLVERLTHVSRQVRFHFTVFDLWVRYHGGRSHTVDPVAWKRAMSTLLDKVLDKGCQELYVTGAAEFSTLYSRNLALRGKDPKRTLMPTVSPVPVPVPVIPQPPNDLPIAVDSIAATSNSISIQGSKPPLPSQETITAKPERLDGAGDTQLVASPPKPRNDLPIAVDNIAATLSNIDIQGSKLPLPSRETIAAKPRGLFSFFQKRSRKTPAPVHLRPGDLGGAGDDKLATRLEQSLTSSPLSSVQHSKQLDEKGNKGDMYPTRNMTLFHIHSKMLLDDPFLDWTISAIMTSASTLTTLSFRCSSVHTYAWHIVLRSLHLPHLRDFALVADFLVTAVPGANHQDLHYFLERHPTIEILNLYGLSQAGSPFTPLKALILPKLIDLKAHPSYITWILSPITMYPRTRLRSITIGSEYLSTGFFKYADFDNAIRSVTYIRRKVKLCICFAGQTECDILSWLQSHVDMHTPPSPIASLHRIRDLVISCFFYADLPVPVLHLLPTWLNLFPSLRSLKFDELLPEVVQRIDALDFKQILADGCPKMERMFNYQGAEVKLAELRGRSRGMEDGSGDSGPGWGMGDPTADGSG